MTMARKAESNGLRPPLPPFLHALTTADSIVGHVESQQKMAVVDHSEARGLEPSVTLTRLEVTRSETWRGGKHTGVTRVQERL